MVVIKIWIIMDFLIWEEVVIAKHVTCGSRIKEDTQVHYVAKCVKAIYTLPNSQNPVGFNSSTARWANLLLFWDLLGQLGLQYPFWTQRLHLLLGSANCLAQFSLVSFFFFLSPYFLSFMIFPLFNDLFWEKTRASVLTLLSMLSAISSWTIQSLTDISLVVISSRVRASPLYNKYCLTTSQVGGQERDKSRVLIMVVLSTQWPASIN